MKFSGADIEQIERKGLKVIDVENQIKIFQRGNIAVNIEAAATVGNGIRQFSRQERENLATYFDKRKADLEILKFVPASGAATRMFKVLHKFLDEFDTAKDTLSSYLEKSNNLNLRRFFEDLEKMPFYDQAFNNSRESQPGFDSLTEEAKKFTIIQTMLFSPGLNLSNYPKGLVPFHNYKKYVATAFEEHLYEAAEYACINGVAKLHFTISEGHKEKFMAEFERIQNRVQESTETNFEISYSYQDSRTDTIAVNATNEPFRLKNDELFFRPGGHGALIDNLNSMDADVVFIKNIDNVVLLKEAKKVAEYKKMLAGKLLQIQERCFKFLKDIEEQDPSKKNLKDIQTFIEDDLFTKFESGFDELSKEEKILMIKDKLNRPLRVCGMVKNEGEPGGGPFLINMGNGSKSLQIIESAQIDSNNEQQLEIARNATHFNPVDIVCGIKNYKAVKFDLHEYIDPSTSFIAEKSHEGKTLKALELPGLWNGAMAKWNTVFVEVPVTTFNPVKTVVDLLKPSHQAN